MDPSYFTNLQNAFCVPDGVNLSLSGVGNSTYRQYFKISIYNKTNATTSSGNLSYLVGNYTIQVMIPIPLPNPKSKSFSYSMYPIRMSNDAKTSTYAYNITLSKLKLTFDDHLDPDKKLTTI